MKVIPVILLFLLFACGQAKEEQTITGEWEYSHMERYDEGRPMDLHDPKISALHSQQKGLTFHFSDKKVFKVTQSKPGDQEGFIAEQPFEIPENDTILVLKNKGRPDDKFPIISLTDSVLKINVFKSPVAYMVFRKKP